MELGKQRNHDTRVHFVHAILTYWYCWKWHPAVVDSFGNLVVIDTRRTAYSLGI